MQKGYNPERAGESKGVAPILIIILVAILGIGGYFVYTSLRGGNKAPDMAISTPSPSPTPSPSNETANWNTYTNTKVGFSIKYPTRYLSKPTFPRGESVKASDATATGDEDNRALLFETELGTGSYLFTVAPFKGTTEELFQKSTDGKLNNLPEILVRSPGADVLQTNLIKEINIFGGKALIYERIFRGYPADQFKEIKKLLVYFTAKDHGFILDSPNSDVKEMELILATFKFTN